ncbi:hypothetical protein [Streptomyces sparsogenes]|uniref:Uncharacterized protein n=1 Tax=Streptomyces sparsogenes DSM 40356 TaxID=1331668 RepID=A0A1R1S7V8_9ACTN|nr:hypothetical protein [Streptomyces sparsogenes]OMI34406.1 hypothetical protein SPAR_36521 [Streptomyces sparsogenes DSM 40356]
MPTVYRNNRRDMKAIQRVPTGTTLYVIEEVSRRVAPYEDPRLCARYEVTHTHPLLGGAMVGSKSVEQLLAEHGTVYTSQPKGVRGMWEPSPQVAGPLGNDTERYLDETEIRGLAKQVRDANDDRRKAKRRGRWI